MKKQTTVYFSGGAQLPKGTASRGYYDIINVGFSVDMVSGEIVDVGISLYSSGAIRFLTELMVGHNIKKEEGFDKLISDINTRYFGHSQKAIIIALRGAYDKYLKYCNKMNKNNL